MQQYNVTGMTCAACSARVEKAVGGVEGVTACSVNLLTHSMLVEGGDSQTIIAAVEKAGYGASVKGQNNEQNDQIKDTETPVLVKRLIASLIFMILLMALSMGHNMWGMPLPSFLATNPVAQGLIQLLLTLAVMVINQNFFISGFKGIVHRSPNMDTLVSLGSGAAFVYSTVVLFQMTANPSSHFLHDLYFESAAMILTLITVGKLLEARSKGKTTNALKGLMQLAPETATLLRDGQEVTVPVRQVNKGDLFTVRPGESIPVDGVVVDGISAVNESAITGESIPVDKSAGDSVTAATINQSGFLTCQAVRVGEDTTLSQIIKMVSDAAATKAPIAKIADKVSGVFVPVVIAIAMITFAVWMFSGQTVGYALARGISVLVISCPCALGLATPVAIMVGSGVGAKHGLLFKTAAVLEQTGKLQIVALDKTGTITKGEPTVTDLLPADGKETEELLQVALSLECKSEHPLAKAILRYGEQTGITPQTVTDFQIVSGGGLTARMDGQLLFGGNHRFVSEYILLPDWVDNQAKELASQGKTPLFFGKDNRFLGLIGVADVIKEDSPAAIAALKKMGIRTVMLTGDNRQTADAIAAKVGVDEVIADVKPDQKEQTVRRLKEQGVTAMVGDGINDAPALTRADVGIAIGAGTDIAMDAADVVLMNSTLADVPAAIRLSRGVLRNIKENLFWAFFYNMVGIPLAAGALVSLLGWEMNPMFGAAAMSLSSFCVVSNALRLNFLNPHSTKHDHKRKTKRKKEQTMTKSMKIEGMMCPHCSGRVKTVLEALPQVASAEVDHMTDSAVVTLNADLSNDLLKETVEKEGYKVVEIQ